MSRAWLCAGLLASLGGCAFTNPANTPLLSATEKALGADTAGSPAHYALLPLALPLGLLDVVVCHPVQVLDDAYRDSKKMIWEEPSGGIATRSYFFLPKVGATPVVFAGSTLLRSFFDIEPHEDESKELEPEEAKARLRARLEDLEQSLGAAIRRRDRAATDIQRIEAEIQELRSRLGDLEQR